MTHIAKVIEIVGNSDKSWQDAAQAALDEAKKTVHGITDVEITDMTAKVDSILEILLNIIQLSK
jgi:dodecin